VEDVFERHFGPMGIPMLFNLPLGHGKNLSALPLGVTATVDADARTLSVEESALEGPGRTEEPALDGSARTEPARGPAEGGTS
jgi:hypothetical protein